ncbi:Marine sediment metagenome DNA, contig: S01H1_S39905 (Fragment) OS=marine sediment metagenome GN=S01H1_80896 PE=4 SV=1 [Gemmata massiliana]|uniref:Marine sediment metagenome DNA, contig: S01H1_S39905 n=1 Tax=Gemmata massiliana TaxID=1210884 RepID=A0A6P2CTI5_9BACT
MPKSSTEQPAVAPAPGRDTGVLKEFSATLRKAQQGDTTALANVREALKKPGVPDLLRGNVAREALSALVNAYAGTNPVAREAVLCKLDEMRLELSGPNPSSLEKFLVERVLATWLHLHTIEAAYASKESMSLAQGQYYQKTMTAAQKRYLAAIKGLAEVRKLALPALQVNIAKKQVNVAAGTVTSY